MPRRAALEQTRSFARRMAASVGWYRRSCSMSASASDAASPAPRSASIASSTMSRGATPAGQRLLAAAGSFRWKYACIAARRASSAASPGGAWKNQPSEPLNPTHAVSTEPHATVCGLLTRPCAAPSRFASPRSAATCPPSPLADRARQAELDDVAVVGVDLDPRRRGRCARHASFATKCARTPWTSMARQAKASAVLNGSSAGGRAAPPTVDARPRRAEQHEIGARVCHVSTCGKTDAIVA